MDTLFQIISSVTGVLTPPNLALAILGLGIEPFPAAYRKISVNILLAF